MSDATPLVAVEDIATLEDARIARSEALDAIDDILNTAAEDGDRALTSAEVAEHDALAQRADALLSRAEALTAKDGTEIRRAAQLNRKNASPGPVFNVNLGRKPASADRTLDELYHATPETVMARGGVVNNGARNDVDQVMLRSGSLAPRLAEFAPEHVGLVQRFQEIVTDIQLVGALTAPKGRTSAAECWEIGRSHARLGEQYDHILRAMDVDTSNEGSDWVPTGIGADLHAKVRASGKIAPLFDRISLPTNPWKWPIEGTDATAYRVGEPTSDTATKVTASTTGTVAATFDAEIIGARTLFSRSLDADSVIAIMPYVRAKLVQAHVDAEEKAILDGDSDGTHQDSDVTGSGTDARNLWDGLRKKALAQTVATATACGVDELNTVRAAMGKWGIMPADLAFIIGVSNYYDLLADDKIVTVDAYGQNATVLNGEVGRVFGIPVIVSEHVRENLNASGVHDGITETKTYMLCVNRGEFSIGQRMALEVEADDSIYRETFQRVLVSFQRADFQHIGSAATDDNVAIAYNVTP